MTDRPSEPRAPSLAGVRDSATVLVLAALAGTLGIAVQSSLAWLLGPEGRGSLAVAFTFASLLATLFAVGTERATQFHVLSGKLTVRQAVLVISLLAVLGSAVAALAGRLLVDSGFSYFDKADRGDFLLALAIMPSTVLVTSFGLLLAAKRRFVASGIADIVGVVTRLALLWLFVGVATLDVAGALLSIAVAGLVTLGLDVWLLSRGEEEKSTQELPGWPVWHSVIGYGLRYYVARLGTIVNVRIGFLVLAVLAAPNEIGLYAAASILIGRFLAVPTAIGKALLPRVGGAEDGRPELVAQSCRASFVIVAACLVALLLSSPVIVPWLLSPAFAPTIPLLWILAPAILLRAATQPMTSYFIGIGRPGVVSVSTAAQLVSNVLLLPLLYPRIGLAAAAWAEAAGHVAASLVLLAAYRSVAGFSFGRTWSWQPADGRLVRELARRLRELLFGGVPRRRHT